MRFKLTLSAVLFFSSCLVAPKTLGYGPAHIKFNPSIDAIDEITISFAGDLIIHEDLYKKVIQDPNKDFSKLWHKTKPLIEKADFSYVNMEGPTAIGITNKLQDVGDIGMIYDKKVYSGTDLLFNYHPSLIDALKKSGFDLVSVANNHSFDRGSKGLDLTIKALKEKFMGYVGIRPSNSSDPLYTLTPIQKINVAWIACTEALNGFKDKKKQLYLCYDQKSEMIQTIQTLIKDKKADVVIITPHWGFEYSHTPQRKQMQLAHEFLEAGASAVIGSHPHVLQPVEKHITLDGRETFIAYSLGNFVANQKGIERKSSAMIYLKFSKNKKGQTVISDYFYEPTTRLRADIFPARHLSDVVKHVEKYLGPLR